ncbi:hypothetical protein VDGL01_02133 [Verticillium dahliae]
MLPLRPVTGCDELRWQLTVSPTSKCTAGRSLSPLTGLLGLDIQLDLLSFFPQLLHNRLPLTQGAQLTASASGFTPFSIIEMQIDNVRRSSWQFYYALVRPEVGGGMGGGARDH